MVGWFRHVVLGLLALPLLGDAVSGAQPEGLWVARLPDSEMAEPARLVLLSERIVALPQGACAVVLERSFGGPARVDGSSCALLAGERLPLEAERAAERIVLRLRDRLGATDLVPHRLTGPEQRPSSEAGFLRDLALPVGLGVPAALQTLQQVEPGVLSERPGEAGWARTGQPWPPLPADLVELHGYRDARSKARLRQQGLAAITPAASPDASAAMLLLQDSDRVALVWRSAAEAGPGSISPAGEALRRAFRGPGAPHVPASQPACLSRTVAWDHQALLHALWQASRGEAERTLALPGNRRSGTAPAGPVHVSPRL